MLIQRQGRISQRDEALSLRYAGQPWPRRGPRHRPPGAAVHSVNPRKLV